MTVPGNWLAPFQVNVRGAAAGTQLDPAVVGLATGDILIAWTEGPDGIIAPEPGSDIVGTILGPEGEVVRAPFRINTLVTDGDESRATFAPTPDGGFAVAYQSDGDGNVEAIAYQRHDAAGDAVETWTLASDDRADRTLSEPRMALDPFTDTAFVTWLEGFGTASLLIGRQVAADGTAGPRIEATGGGEQAVENLDVDIIGDGSLVLAYRTPTFAAFTVTDDALLPLSPPTPLVPGLPTPGGTVEAAGDSFFVAIRPPDRLPEIILQKWDETGTVELGLILLANPAGADDELLQLGGNQLLGLWSTVDGDLAARVFNATRPRLFDTVPVAEGPAITPALARTADGRIAIAWQEPGGEIFATIRDARGPRIDAASYDAPTRQFVGTDVITTRALSTTLLGDDDGDTLLGRGGNDTIRGEGGDDLVRGGPGNDVLSGGPGRDTVRGEQGDDRILVGPGEAIDDVDGGEGFDLLDLSERTDGVRIDTDAGVFGGGLSGGETVSLPGIEGIVGTGGDDRIRFDVDRDRVEGGPGDDTLSAGLSIDTVSGGEGNDLIRILAGEFVDHVDGGPGDDMLDLSTKTAASEAADVDLAAGTWRDGGFTPLAPYPVTDVEHVLGTGADDALRGSDDANRLVGNGGGDTLEGRAGEDSLVGGAGDDVVAGGDGADRLFGVEGADELSGGAGADLVGGGPGDDILLGGPDRDTLAGGAGDDVLDGMGGIDHLFGQDGDDRVFALRNDLAGIVRGGAGEDVLEMMGGPADVVAKDEGAVLDLPNDVAGFERVNGRAGDDVLDASPMTGAIFLFGGGGDDGLVGGAGPDTLAGGPGNDVLDGAGETDHLFGQGGDDTVFALQDDLGGIVRGGAGEDVLEMLGGPVDVVVKDEGAALDRANDVAGFERVDGRAADDLLDASPMTEAIFLFGGGGDDGLVGGAGPDTLVGGPGADTLDGGAGPDTLYGGAGNDVLRPGTDIGHLRGEAGGDRFVLEPASGIARILDMTPGEDVIDMTGFKFRDAADVAARTAFVADGDDLRILVDNALAGRVHDYDFDPADFAFALI